MFWRTPRSTSLVLALALSTLIACSNDFDALLAGSASASGSTSATSATSATGATGVGGSGAVGAGSSDGGAVASSTGSAAAGGMNGTGGTGATGGSSSCGDGVIDPGEECDSGAAAKPGCAGCLIQCSGAGEVHDTATHHCYYRDVGDTPRSWDDSRAFCQTTWGGGDLVVLEAIAEYDFLLPSMPTPSPQVFFFVGGGDQAQEGVYQWIDGSPVSYPVQQVPWMTSPPQPDGNGNCMIWRADVNPNAEGLGDLPCTDLYHPFCERLPPTG